MTQSPPNPEQPEDPHRGAPGGPGQPAGGPGQPPGGPGHPQQPAGGQPTPPSPSEERGLALAIHLGGILTSFVVPLIIWLIYRERSAFLDDHGKAALNWHILLLGGYLLAVLTMFILIGLLIYFAVFVVAVVFGVMSAIAANNGQPHRYPVDIKLIK
ncbi:DUF4870 domain-containing protein [Nesterenkonia alba]|uniref:DUF4870 domain-containing protein n=1 Tax=Nesterenkonia alba TaxID=515814 RepID=UPI00041FCF9D|nr:DUF4870 domain-containing protein [Nesterenkonia alba]